MSAATLNLNVTFSSSPSLISPIVILSSSSFENIRSLIIFLPALSKRPSCTTTSSTSLSPTFSILTSTVTSSRSFHLSSSAPLFLILISLIVRFVPFEPAAQNDLRRVNVEVFVAADSVESRAVTVTELSPNARALMSNTLRSTARDAPRARGNVATEKATFAFPLVLNTILLSATFPVFVMLIVPF